MSDKSSVNVGAISALEEMRASLLRFQSEAGSAVRNAQPEITAALNGLQERLHYWQHQLRARQDALAQARDALARCLSLRGPNGERADCSGPSAAVRQAERRVQEAQEAIRIAQSHIKRVEEAHANFQRQAQRFYAMLTSHELPKATALLSRSIDILQSYTSSGGRSGSIAASIPAAAASSHGADFSALREIVFAPFSNSALRTAANLFAAAVIVGAGVAWPYDATQEIPGQTEAPTASASAERASPIRQIAKQIEEIAHGAQEAEEKKKENGAEIKKILQQGQHSVPPPEKL